MPGPPTGSATVTAGSQHPQLLLPRERAGIAGCAQRLAHLYLRRQRQRPQCLGRAQRHHGRRLSLQRLRAAGAKDGGLGRDPVRLRPLRAPAGGGQRQRRGAEGIHLARRRAGGGGRRQRRQRRSSTSSTRDQLGTPQKITNASADHRLGRRVRPVRQCAVRRRRRRLEHLDLEQFPLGRRPVAPPTCASPANTPTPRPPSTKTGSATTTRPSGGISRAIRLGWVGGSIPTDMWAGIPLGVSTHWGSSVHYR